MYDAAHAPYRRIKIPTVTLEKSNAINHIAGAAGYLTFQSSYTFSFGQVTVLPSFTLSDLQKPAASVQGRRECWFPQPHRSVHGSPVSKKILPSHVGTKTSAFYCVLHTQFQIGIGIRCALASDWPAADGRSEAVPVLQPRSY